MTISHDGTQLTQVDSLRIHTAKHCSLYKLKCHIKAYGIWIPLTISMRSLWFRGIYFKKKKRFLSLIKNFNTVPASLVWNFIATEGYKKKATFQRYWLTATICLVLQPVSHVTLLQNVFNDNDARQMCIHAYATVCVKTPCDFKTRTIRTHSDKIQ